MSVFYLAGFGSGHRKTGTILLCARCGGSAASELIAAGGGFYQPPKMGFIVENRRVDPK